MGGAPEKKHRYCCTFELDQICFVLRRSSTVRVSTGKQGSLPPSYYGGTCKPSVLSRERANSSFPHRLTSNVCNLLINTAILLRKKTKTTWN